MGVRVAKGIFVTCAHSVTEKIAESNSPADEHFKRDRICVGGQLVNLLAMGKVEPWSDDVALLEAQDDWAEMDNGSVAAVKTATLDIYRVCTSGFFFSDFRAYFRYSHLAPIFFCHATDSRVTFNMEWASLRFTATPVCLGHQY